MLHVNGTPIQTDKDGFLVDLDQWSAEVAEHIAHKEGVSLSDEHWEIIHLVRQYYEVFELSPAMRPLVKFTQQQLGPDKGKSVYLLRLFPGSPSKLAAKIAGLPRPANCL